MGGGDSSLVLLGVLCISKEAGICPLALGVDGVSDSSLRTAFSDSISSPGVVDLFTSSSGAANEDCPSSELAPISDCPFSELNAISDCPFSELNAISDYYSFIRLAVISYFPSGGAAISDYYSFIRTGSDIIFPIRGAAISD